MATTIDTGAAIERAGQLFERSSWTDAVDVLTEANRRRRDPALAREILRMRNAAFATAPTVGRDAWPPAYDDLFDDLAPGAIPEVDRSELSAATLGAGLVHHGSLLVRELVDPATVAALVADVDAALEAARAWLDGAPADDTAPWFEIFTPAPPHSVGLSRRFVVQGGGVLGPDSPLAMCRVIDVLDAAGLRPVLTEYLGERPALSAKKTTLRRVPPDSGSDWHQDGAFLGSDVRTVNVWLALTDCGVTAPGLDVVPKRIDLVETGTEGAIFDWSVGRPVVERAAGSAGIARPHFRAGDALLFDDRNLHSTACAPEMTEARYAIEAWFFAPSCYPGDQVPVLF